MSGSEPQVCAFALSTNESLDVRGLQEGVVAPVKPCEELPSPGKEELTLELVGASSPNWGKMNVLFLTGDPRDPQAYLIQYII